MKRRKYKKFLRRCAYCRSVFNAKSKRNIYCKPAHRLAMHRLLRQNPPQAAHNDPPPLALQRQIAPFEDMPF